MWEHKDYAQMLFSQFSHNRNSQRIKTQTGYYKVIFLRQQWMPLWDRNRSTQDQTCYKNITSVGVSGESDDVSPGPKTHGKIMTNNMSLPDTESSITASLF